MVVWPGERYSCTFIDLFFGDLNPIQTILSNNVRFSRSAISVEVGNPHIWSQQAYLFFCAGNGVHSDLFIYLFIDRALLMTVPNRT